MNIWKKFKRCCKKRALGCVEENILGHRKRIDFSINLLPAKKGRFLDICSANGLFLETVGTDVLIGADVSLVYCKMIMCVPLMIVFWLKAITDSTSWKTIMMFLIPVLTSIKRMKEGSVTP